MRRFTMPDTLPEGDEKVEAVRSMFDAIAPRYDLVNRVMTFRMDVGWRHKTVVSLGLPASSTVLDLACGTGDLCGELTSNGLRPIGVDMSFGMLAAARTDAPLVHGDALRLPFPDGSVSGVTCGFALRNFASLPPFLAELARVVRPGGRVALLEVAEPPNRLLRAGHRIYFGRVVPLVGGLLSDPAAYRYLPRSIAYLPEPSEMLDQLARAGFDGVDRRLLSVGIAQLITGTRGRLGVTPLVARTRRIDQDLDLLALAGRDGVLLERGRTGLAGRGLAARVPLSEVDDALSSIESDDEVGVPGTGPVAFGALPYRADPSTDLVIPEVVWGRADDGTRWVTTISAPEVPMPDTEAPSAAPLPQPSSVAVRPVRPAEWWCELVARATKAMREAPEGGLSKVVLAREVLVEADVPFDRAVVLERLRRGYPGCFLFHVDGFLGASPELLVGRTGDIVRAQPMAGTAPRGGDPATDARLAASLLASPTYRREHQITIDMVFDTLIPWCSYLDYEPEPSVVGVANVQHLATMVEGRLSRPAPSILELVTALHPTPAVNGWPRDDARGWIEAHEGFDRGRYAGTVGWVDARGNGTFAVSIRCADIDGATARLVAGNGIVADSDPDTELAETQIKLQAVLNALTRV